MRCRGGACPSRRCTCSPYKPPSKWQTPPDLSLRGGRRPTWRPEREARGSALGVQSRGTCPDHKKPRRKRKTFYRDIFRQNVFDISGAGGYNKDVETQTVATNITYLFPICELDHSQISESSGCDRRLTFFLSEANRRSGRDDNGYSNTPVSPGVFVIRQYTASVPCRPFNGRRVRYIPGTP